ncbi:EAL domain-containing protein [Ferrimonas sp.]|uniref:bifunctional diguanylate cyclase/phosphodiesterase n=1 Tax=Ferrimonas sp. TaxID=2080861 RepID=UPI003A8E827C
MTLYRQLLILLWMTLLISLVAVVAVNFRASSESLQAQLHTNTENALTSLGMSVSPYLDPVDETLVEGTLNAAFDGAFYRKMRIELYAVDRVFERENSANPEGVPAWFITLFPFPSVVAEAPITTGWTESALVTIEGHPGFIQQQLWQITFQLLLVYGSLFLAAALFGSWGIRLLIRPLSQIEAQAKAIEAKDFDHRIPLPKTRELKRVVLVMNNLMKILQERFASHARQLETMRVKLQQDGETGIATRQHLVNELEANIADTDKHGALVMLRLLDAEKIRKSFGYGAWSKLLNQSIESLQGAFGSEEVVVGRMSEAELALLIPTVPRADLSAELQGLRETLTSLRQNGIAPQDAIFLLAGTTILADDTKASVLTRSDNLLSELAAKGVNLAKWADNMPQGSLRTGQEWVALLRERIDTGKLHLETQGVFSELDGQAIHHEVYVRLLDESGTQMPAGAFMPVIEQFDLGVALDLSVLKKVLSTPQGAPQALNISLSSMRDTRFVGRLSSLSREELGRVVIEVSEQQLKRDRELVESFIQILNSLSIKFGFDNVGATGISLDYVTGLKPAYLKVAPGLCRGTDEDSLMLVTGICNTVHNLEVPVYATVVENQAQLEKLQQTGIDGFQGYINKG